jgi:hypothetical protein
VLKILYTLAGDPLNVEAIGFPLPFYHSENI